MELNSLCLSTSRVARGSVCLLLTLGTVLLGQVGRAESPPRSSPAPSAQASPSSAAKLASFQERLAAAKSVKVQTDILGVTLGSSLTDVHAKLDPLADPSKPPTEEGGEKKQGEEEHRVLWQLAGTGFSSIYVKADDEDRIIYVAGFVRPGKEIPFAKIGELEKAPIHTANNVAWDVVRPGKPLTRVVLRGTSEKASAITIFVVKRPVQR